MGQLLVQYEDIWPIGTLPIKTSPDPFPDFVDNFHSNYALKTGQPFCKNFPAYSLNSRAKCTKFEGKFDRKFCKNSSLNRSVDSCQSRPSANQSTCTCKAPSLVKLPRKFTAAICNGECWVKHRTRGDELPLPFGTGELYTEEPEQNALVNVSSSQRPTL